jgi:hypothetical protein
MLDSMQAYCRGLLDGLAMPQGVPGPLVAWVTPPVVEKANAPRAYVWGGRLRGRRQTAPRGPGFMALTWTVDVYLHYMSTPGKALAEEPFPKVVDAVLKTFMTTTMPLFVDAYGNPVGPNATSETDTQVQAIGEAFDGDYPPERTVDGPRMLWYAQRLGVEVLEVVQA